MTIIERAGSTKLQGRVYPFRSFDVSVNGLPIGFAHALQAFDGLWHVNCCVLGEKSTALASGVTKRRALIAARRWARDKVQEKVT